MPRPAKYKDPTRPTTKQFATRDEFMSAYGRWRRANGHPDKRPTSKRRHIVRSKRRPPIEKREDIKLRGDWSMPVKTTADFMAMPPEKAAKFIGEVIRKEARLV